MNNVVEPASGVLRLRSVELECGRVLEQVDVAYQMWGEPNPSRSNAILVCHALTGDAGAGRVGDQPGWWEGAIGPGKALDTNRFWIICSNVLGSCYGSTGPTSVDPSTGQVYGVNFPIVTIRDMVHVQGELADHLGIQVWHAVVGGSLGGMQVIEWTITFPERMRLAAMLGACARTSAMAIAYNDVMRLAIMNDPDWKDGRYRLGKGPRKGLALSRMVGMITYRSAVEFEERFGRALSVEDPFRMESRFEVENYLRYQGEKFVRRFDANTKLCLLKAMDLHDIGRGRGGMDRAVERIECKLLLVGINTDLLFPPAEQEDLFAQLQSARVQASYREIISRHGHDAFLLEFDQVNAILGEFLNAGATD